jgi:hypothetical protein
MVLQQVANKPAGRRTLLPQGVQPGLDWLRHLNQQPYHLHDITPFPRMICLLSSDSELCQVIFDAMPGRMLGSPAMARTLPEGTGAWNFRDIPRDLMRKVKMAAAHEGKTVKDFLIEIAEARLQELERKGILPKSKG